MSSTGVVECCANMVMVEAPIRKAQRHVPSPVNSISLHSPANLRQYNMPESTCLAIACRFSGKNKQCSTLVQGKIRVALGERIKELRRLAGYSQESFADHVGIHRTYAGELERGEANVTLENLVRVA